MGLALRGLFELDDTTVNPVETFASDTLMMRDTMLQREIFSQGPRVETQMKWDRRDYERALAPITGRSAASHQVKAPDKSTRVVPAFHVRINIPLTGEQLNAMRALGRDGTNSNAVDEIQAARKQLRALWLRTKEKLLADCLLGTTTVDSSTFPEGTTVEGVSITWGVTALAVSASWATAGTDVPKDIGQTFKAAIVDASGALPAALLANEVIFGYFNANTAVKNFLSGLPRSEQLLNYTASRFDGMGGVPRFVEYLGSYKPVGGSVTRFIPNNKAILLPEGYQQYLTYSDAAQDIPKIGAAGVIARSGEIVPQAGDGPDKAYGWSEYVIQEGDPPNIKLVGQAGIAFANRYPETFGVEADVTS